MNEEKIKERLNTLASLILKHNILYHQKDKPKISDENFDKLVKISKVRQGKDEIYKLNCAWTKKQLGWYDNTNIKEGLKKTIKFYDLMIEKLKNEPMTFKLKQ